MTQTDLAKALRQRFESDALLGASVLPVRCTPPPSTARSPARSTASFPKSPNRPVAQSHSSPAALPPLAPAAPFIPLQQLSPDESESRRAGLDAIDRAEVQPCTKCGLHAARTKTVFGTGSHLARILFVGEGPGADEDASGIPFVGRAGELLTTMIQNGMGLRREDVYICNVVKCRPPNNRTPAPDEVAACKGYLFRQIEIIQPDLIIALGAPATQTLLNTREGINRLRGRLHDFNPSGSALIGNPIPLMPTFHPAYLLRCSWEKAKAWADLKLVMTHLGIPLPARP